MASLYCVCDVWCIHLVTSRVWVKSVRGSVLDTKPVLQTAHMLQMWRALDFCCKFLETQMDTYNSLPAGASRTALGGVERCCCSAKSLHPGWLLTFPSCICSTTVRKSCYIECCSGSHRPDHTEHAAAGSHSRPLLPTAKLTQWAMPTVQFCCPQRLTVKGTLEGGHRAIILGSLVLRVFAFVISSFFKGTVSSFYCRLLVEMVLFIIMFSLVYTRAFSRWYGIWRPRSVLAHACREEYSAAIAIQQPHH